MPETPLFHMRLPLYLRREIDQLRKHRTVTGWILEAIQEKLQRESRETKNDESP
jgi:hypothetical protein